MKARFVVGIDLGTTHTAVAYAALDAPLSPSVVNTFAIDQTVAAGQVAARPLLPSFRYHPSASEMTPADTVLPWPVACLSDDPVGVAGQAPIVGEWARELGARRQGALVASAKSWLSHDQVDRTADILPWGVEGVAKVSPVMASASYLHHVRQAWDLAHPDAPLADQQIVLTVPASFDEAARAYTLEASRLAGLPRVRLLEEPQAVCYDWYVRHIDDAAAQLAGVKLMLVVDVGGGTTDLSLIRIGIDAGELQLTRIAVGDHLMLGGDNLDLALARHLEPALVSEGQRLSPVALGQLIQQTRLAKERLLNPEGPSEATVTLVGSGSRLIGGARSAVLSRTFVHSMALDGFLPLTAVSDVPNRTRSAVVEFGLPYVADPAISRHLAEFFQRHADACAEALGDTPAGAAIADCVIYNGGFFQTPLMRERLAAVLQQWSGREVRMLDNPHPDQAVAHGAVAFGLLRQHRRRTIGGGSARSFFLLVETAGGERQALCLLPKGSPEGQDILLPDRRFVLKLGQPVSFSLASWSGDTRFVPGDLLPADTPGLLMLPPLMQRLEQERTRTDVTVMLSAQLDDTGLLRVACVDVTGEGRWQLDFLIRQPRQTLDLASLPPRFPEARELLADVFVRSDRQFDPKRVKQVRDELERFLRPREHWDLPLLRALFDELLKGAGKRRRSAAHERLWFNLAGYALRPGFGYPLDEWRVDQCWELFVAGLHHAQESQAWAEWWTFWRRLAGGLEPARQETLLATVEPYLNPANARNSKIQTELKVRSYEDMVRLAASLEALPAPRKATLGQWFATRLARAGETPTTWWALGRVGARVPFHGNAHTVLPVDIVTPWIDMALREDWKKTPQAAFAAVMMARMSGDRARDLDDALRQRVLAALRSAKASALWVSLVSEVVSLDEGENRRVFGEALPLGLVLLS